MSFRKLIFFIILVFLPYKIVAKEFLNTYLHLNFAYMYGLSTWGDITEYEHKNFAIKDPNDNMKNVRPEHKDVAYGILMDITPFPAIIMGNAEYAIKMGLRMGYRFHTVEQKISLEKKDYSQDIMKFRTLMFGPVLYYAPSIEPSLTSKRYNSNSGLSCYVLFGQLQGGEINAFPIWKKYDPSTYPLAASKTKIKGYKIDAGIGGEIAICGSVNLGLNFYYSMISYEMSSKLYTGVSKNSTLNEVCLEIFMGIPIQYF